MGQSQGKGEVQPGSHQWGKSGWRVVDQGDRGPLGIDVSSDNEFVARFLIFFAVLHSIVLISLKGCECFIAHKLRGKRVEKVCLRCLNIIIFLKISRFRIDRSAFIFSLLRC